MNKIDKIKALRIVVSVAIVVIISFVLWSLLPLIKNLSTVEGQIAFKQEIDSMGARGLLLLFGLQILQILLVVLPGEPFEVLAGMYYGTWGGCLFITISVFITTIIIFFTVRKLGQKYLYNFFKKEKVDKVMNSKILNDHKTLDFILFLLFFLPATPKDLLVYIGGLLPIKPWRFILISTFARFPSVITSTMVGAHLTKGNWKASLLIYLITFIIAAIIMFLIRVKDKEKNKEIIDIIK